LYKLINFAFTKRYLSKKLTKNSSQNINEKMTWKVYLNLLKCLLIEIGLKNLCFFMITTYLFKYSWIQAYKLW
jgi:hypothetical protein